MSAIAGIVNFDKKPVEIEKANKMMEDLEAYPADDVRIWVNENVFLACHSQWITPEAQYEQLPQHDNLSDLTITADAIIDNRHELIDLLHVENRLRRVITDSELILLAYQKWGEDCPKHLLGEFTFMIWDERKQMLFGARDFSGGRTLHYYSSPQEFSFCTIIHPLFSLPHVQKQLNEQWLAEFLAIPGMVDSIDTSSTPYQNIYQIPPSHSITVKKGKINFTRYTTIVEGEKLKLRSNEEYVEAFREVFQVAVDARIRTFGQVGSHLSGGLDSGTVVSFASKSLKREGKRLNTFSYVPEENFSNWMSKVYIPDERDFIRSTVQHVGNINDYYLDFKGKSSLSEVDDWLEMLEMPYKYFENSFWMKGIYEKANQEEVKLLLNGARGNFTISWGTATDYYANLLKKMKWVCLYKELNQYSNKTGIKKRQMLYSIGKKAFPYISPETKYQFPSLINESFAQKHNIFDRLQDSVFAAKRLPSSQEMRRRQFEQLYFWNKNGTLGTKLSLRYSLWDRDPTNDLRVIRFCLSLPENQFVQNGWDRALVRRASKGFLPNKVRLNRFIGVQGADVIQRMSPSWDSFINEVKGVSIDPIVSEFFNMKLLKKAISKIEGQPRPEYAFDDDFRVLMRSLIVNRFIKKFA